MSRIAIHVPPDREDCLRNSFVEPEGERLRRELEDWLDRNHIVSLLLDTERHCVDVQIVKLPPRIKPALRVWGSIFVEDLPERPNEPETVVLVRKFRRPGAEL